MKQICYAVMIDEGNSQSTILEKIDYNQIGNILSNSDAESVITMSPENNRIIGIRMNNKIIFSEEKINQTLRSYGLDHGILAEVSSKRPKLYIIDT